jgi:hypothetical protein
MRSFEARLLENWILYTSWSKSHATRIKIFINGCNSVQFDCINRLTISLWLYNSPRRSRHVVTWSHQSVVLKQSKPKMSFSQVQRMFVVKHYLASRSYLTSHKVFRDSLVPKRSTVFRLVNRFRETWRRAVHFKRQRRNFTGLHQTGRKQEEHTLRSTRWPFPSRNITPFYFSATYFLTNTTWVRNGLLASPVIAYAVNARNGLGKLANQGPARQWLTSALNTGEVGLRVSPRSCIYAHVHTALQPSINMRYTAVGWLISSSFNEALLTTLAT